MINRGRCWLPPSTGTCEKTRLTCITLRLGWEGGAGSEISLQESPSLPLNFCLPWPLPSEMERCSESKPFKDALRARGTSLVVQWLRIHLAMQGTQVRSPVGKLRSHMPSSKQACVPQLESAGHNQRVCALHWKIPEDSTRCSGDPEGPNYNPMWPKRTL